MVTNTSKKTVPGYVHRTCLGCGNEFTASRADAKCCSVSCRQRYKRKCDGITADTLTIPGLDNIAVPILPAEAAPVKGKRVRSKPSKSAKKSGGKAAKKGTRTATRSKPSKKGKVRK